MMLKCSSIEGGSKYAVLFGELGVAPVIGQKSVAHPAAGGDAKRLGGPLACQVRASLAAAHHPFGHDENDPVVTPMA
jgi:hypothetical protein